MADRGLILASAKVRAGCRADRVEVLPPEQPDEFPIYVVLSADDPELERLRPADFEAVCPCCIVESHPEARELLGAA